MYFYTDKVSYNVHIKYVSDIKYFCSKISFKLDNNNRFKIPNKYLLLDNKNNSGKLINGSIGKDFTCPNVYTNTLKYLLDENGKVVIRKFVHKKTFLPILMAYSTFFGLIPVVYRYYSSFKGHNG